MLTDHHCHILPGIDDGSKNEDMSLEMIRQMHAQGVERIVATPHFYCHREKSVERFLEKRQQALSKVKSLDIPIKDIRLGAEVAIEHGISEVSGIENLAIEGTDFILLEFPYTAYAGWMMEEIENISCEFGLTPVIAHIHRYMRFFSKEDIANVLAQGYVFQINNEAFGNWTERRFVKALIKDGHRVVFGSDCHNIDTRKPNFDLLLKKMKADEVEGLSEKVFDG